MRYEKTLVKTEVTARQKQLKLFFLVVSKEISAFPTAATAIVLFRAVERGKS
jgi:hypothetical protein